MQLGCERGHERTMEQSRVAAVCMRDGERYQACLLSQPLDMDFVMGLHALDCCAVLTWLASAVVVR